MYPWLFWIRLGIFCRNDWTTANKSLDNPFNGNFFNLEKVQLCFCSLFSSGGSRRGETGGGREIKDRNRESEGKLLERGERKRTRVEREGKEIRKRERRERERVERERERNGEKGERRERERERAVARPCKRSKHVKIIFLPILWIITLFLRINSPISRRDVVHHATVMVQSNPEFQS